MKAIFVLVALHLIAFALGMWQPLDRADPWSLVGYGFTHAGGWHLAANMLALLSLGLGVEREAGATGLLTAYGTGLIGAGIAHLLWGGASPVVGASGGVAALLVAYAATNPRKTLWLLVLPLRAPVAAGLFAAFGAACVWFGWLPRIAHVAHLGGMFFGGLWAVAQLKEKSNGN
jgi:membrane associated rhomboid family serine protease